MGNETRVNLKHLLEDLRDAYSSPIEEVIVTELIANSLDSGATQIRLRTQPEDGIFSCIDNGEGMNRAAMRSYHNIAASTKERGAGIGFAGVGAKLSLLVARRVVTESRGKHGAQGAAEWYLKNAFRAPWKFVPFSGVIETGKGTSVSIILDNQASPLLAETFLIKTIQRHFYPLVARHEPIGKMFKLVYKKPIDMFVNGQEILVASVEGDTRSFFVHLGKNRKAIGAGFIERAKLDENFWSRLFGHEGARSADTGLRISTYGKVIRGGWEWLGVEVKHPELLSGVVEVPAFSEILTTNKSDFLSTPQALKKYYEIRKAIQRTIVPVLRELGELEEVKNDQKTPAAFKPLTHDIEGALSLMTEAFPELEALVGEHWHRRKALEVSGKKKRKQQGRISSIESPMSAPSGIDVVPRERTDMKINPDGTRTKRERSPGLQIAFEPFAGSECGQLAKLVEEKVIVNTAHPSWTRAQVLAQEPYHVLLAVALTLAQEMQPQGGVPAFVNEFFRAWSEASEKSGTLL